MKVGGNTGNKEILIIRFEINGIIGVSVAF